MFHTGSPNLSEKDNVYSDIEDEMSFRDFVHQQPLLHDISQEEESTLLREKIEDLQKENGHLRRALDDTEERLENLEKTCNPRIREILEKTKKVAANKIVKLKKRCNHKNAELKELRTKCEKLEESLASKEEELQNERSIDNCKEIVNEIKPTDVSECNEEEIQSYKDQLMEKEDQLKILTEKLHQTNGKLYESKNTCTTLRQEINKAQKLLCSEVGESVTIASLTNRSSAGWRGRAKQVQQLQQKVAELQGKLHEYERTSKLSSPSLSSFSVSSEQKNAAYLRNLEKERRQQIENSTRELRQTEVALEGTQKKLQAARARIKVLENDLNNVKTKLMLLNEKRVHDDQLIEALNGQLKVVEDRFREREEGILNQKNKAEVTCLELTNELNSVRTQVELLRKKLDERETEINSLKNTGATSKLEGSWQSSPVKIIDETQIDTPRSFKDPNEYVTLSVASEAERQRLLELVTLLNRRLDKERTETDHISELLRQERNKNAKLDTRLQRLEIEKVGIPKVNTGYRTKSLKSLTSLAAKENMNAEKMQFRMELLEEECLALKTRLTTIQQDKATDLAIYKKMLEQTRKTFQDAFRGKINYTAGCHSNVTI